MASISVQLEDRLEGTSNFNTWKVRVINIIEEHGLDYFVTIVIEESTTNAWRINYTKNQAKEKMIIYDSVKDNLMSVITPLKTKKWVFWHTHESLWEEGPYSKEGFEEQVVQHEYGKRWDHSLILHKDFTGKG